MASMPGSVAAAAAGVDAGDGPTHAPLSGGDEDTLLPGDPRFMSPSTRRLLETDGNKELRTNTGGGFLYRALLCGRKDKKKGNGGHRNVKPSALEGLDLDDFSSPVYDAHIRSRSPCQHRRVAVLRYVVLFFIGITVALTAALIIYCCRSLIHARFTSVYNLVAQESEGNLPKGVSFVAFWLIGLAYAIVAALPVTFIEPAAGGSGLPETIAILNGLKIPRLVRIKTLVCRVFGNIFAVASGLPVGYEAIMVAAGGAIGAGISQGKSTTLGCNTRWTVFSEFRTDKEKTNAIVAGAGAGLAAAFNSPAGSVIFSMEETASFWSRSLAWRAFFCSMVAAYVTDIFLSGINDGTQWGKLSSPGMFNFGSFSDTGQTSHGWSFWEIPLFLLLGVLGGLAGAAFVALNRRVAAFRIKYINTSKLRRLLDVIAVHTVVAILAFIVPLTMGTCAPKPTTGPDAQYADQLVSFYCAENEFNDIASFWFAPTEEAIRLLYHVDSGQIFPVTHLLTFFLVYTFLMCVGSSISVPAGLFIPTLLSGSALGRLVGQVANSLLPGGLSVDAGVYALIGSASMLGGTTRMAISLAVILLEATGNYTYGLPIMVTLMTARLTGNVFNHGIYGMLIELRHFPVLEDKVKKSIANELRVCDVMTKDVLVFQEVEQVARIADTLRNTEFSGFPVVFSEAMLASHPRLGNLAGYIQRKHLAVLLAHRAFHADLPQQRFERMALDEDADKAAAPTDTSPYPMVFTAARPSNSTSARSWIPSGVDGLGGGGGGLTSTGSGSFRPESMMLTAGVSGGGEGRASMHGPSGAGLARLPTIPSADNTPATPAGAQASLFGPHGSPVPSASSSGSPGTTAAAAAGAAGNAPAASSGAGSELERTPALPLPNTMSPPRPLPPSRELLHSADVMRGAPMPGTSPPGVVMSPLKKRAAREDAAADAAAEAAEAEAAAGPGAGEAGDGGASADADADAGEGRLHEGSDVPGALPRPGPGSSTNDTLAAMLRATAAASVAAVATGKPSSATFSAGAANPFASPQASSATSSAAAAGGADGAGEVSTVNPFAAARDDDAAAGGASSRNPFLPARAPAHVGPSNPFISPREPSGSAAWRSPPGPGSGAYAQGGNPFVSPMSQSQGGGGSGSGSGSGSGARGGGGGTDESDERVSNRRALLAARTGRASSSVRLIRVPLPGTSALSSASVSTGMRLTGAGAGGGGGGGAGGGYAGMGGSPLASSMGMGMAMPGGQHARSSAALLMGAGAHVPLHHAPAGSFFASPSAGSVGAGGAGTMLSPPGRGATGVAGTPSYAAGSGSGGAGAITAAATAGGVHVAGDADFALTPAAGGGGGFGSVRSRRAGDGSGGGGSAGAAGASAAGAGGANAPSLEDEDDVLAAIVEPQQSAALYAALYDGQARYPDEPRLRWRDFEAAYPRYPDARSLVLSAEERLMYVDLRPYMDPTPITVHVHTPLQRAFKLFKELGLRHLLVTNNSHDVVGVISRNNLTNEALHACYEAVKAAQDERAEAAAAAAAQQAAIIAAQHARARALDGSAGGSSGGITGWFGSLFGRRTGGGGGFAASGASMSGKLHTPLLGDLRSHSVGLSHSNTGIAPIAYSASPSTGSFRGLSGLGSASGAGLLGADAAAGGYLADAGSGGGDASAAAARVLSYHGHSRSGGPSGDLAAAASAAMFSGAGGGYAGAGGDSAPLLPPPTSPPLAPSASFFTRSIGSGGGAGGSGAAGLGGAAYSGYKGKGRVPGIVYSQYDDEVGVDAATEGLG